MRVENVKKLGAIVDILKAGDPVEDESVSGKLKSESVVIKRLITADIKRKMLRDIIRNLRKVWGRTNVDLAHRLLGEYDGNIEDANDIALEREINGLDKALQSLYILIDNGYVCGDDIDSAVQDLFLSAWVATCLFLNKEPVVSRNDIKALLDDNDG